MFIFDSSFEGFLLLSESMKQLEAVHDPEGLSQIAATGELPATKVTK